MGKRKVLSGVSLLVSFSLLFAGCGSSGAKKGDTDKSGTNAKVEDNAKVNPAGTYPIVKEKQTFRVFSPQNAFVDNIETNDFTKWYEEKTNVHIEWEVVPSTAAKDKIQVKLASADLPDIFLGGGVISEAQQVMYGSQGFLLPLNNSIEKYGPNIKKMFEKNPQTKTYAYTPDGNIYTLPRIVESLNESMPKRMWIYQPWLDKLGLKMPTTTDEFYEVLKAFKTKDPTGKGDAVPLAGANPDKNANNEVEGFLMMSFLFYDRSYLYMDGDKVTFLADKPEYKEGIKYIKKLYSEGLIAKDTYMQDRTALTALTENGPYNKLGCVTAFYWGHFTVENGPSGRDKEFVTVPPLKGPTGLRQAYDRGTLMNNGLFAATKECKNVDAAVRWVDYFFNQQEMYNNGFIVGMGKEGIGWKKPPEGTKGIDGRPAKYEYILPPGTKNNNYWFQSVPTYEDRDFIYSMAANMTTSRKEVFGTQEQIAKYQPYAVNKTVPHLYYSEDQLAKSGDLKKAVQDVVNGFQIKFVTGTLDIDKDWDAYLKELKNARVDEYVKVTQDAYTANAKNSKK